MKRHIAKGLTMLMLVVGLALASAAVANGQAGHQVTTRVPFDFIVADKTFRSGQYEVLDMNAAGDALSIKQVGGGSQTILLTSSVVKNGQRDTAAKLVFHRYGDTYFLSQVWLAGRSTGSELARSRQERAIQRELKQIAAYHGDVNPVYEVVEVILAGR